MTVKRGDFKVGDQYSLNSADNVFEVLAKHKDYLWILWIDNDDVESVYFERDEIERVNVVSTAKV